MAQLNVNGNVLSFEAEDDTPLLWVLREQLGLTGTKIGCNESECGICTVQVDGVPVLSCNYPAFKAQGRTVVTVEGLARHDPDGTERLHPLQEAFIAHGAVQCGFCTPGLLMTAAALLAENPDPTDHDIRVALKDTYCRCTGYASVIRAIHSAASALRGEGHLPPAEPAVSEPLAHISVSEPVPGIADRVTGRAKYTDDYTFPGMLYGATLRAAYPQHADLITVVPVDADVPMWQGDLRSGRISSARALNG